MSPSRTQSFCLCTQKRCRRDMIDRQAATSRNCLRRFEFAQCSLRGPHDIDRVRRPKCLGQCVVNSGAFQDRAHRTTGDNTGTGSGGLQEHNAGGLFTRNRVRDSSLNARHLEGVLFRLFNALSNRCGNFLCLAVAHAYRAVTISDDNQSGETESTTTLNYLGDAVDSDDTLDVLVIAATAPIAVTTAAVPAAVTAVAPFTGGTGALVGAARRALCPATLRCSHQTILCCRSKVKIVVIITGSARLRVRRPQPQPLARDSGYHRGQKRPQ